MRTLENLYVFEDEDRYHLRIQNSNNWSREVLIRKGDDMEYVHRCLETFVDCIRLDIRNDH